VTEFFGKKHKVPVMSMKELFDFTTDISIHDQDVDAYLEAVQQTVMARLLRR
jgi:hypothetical protein